MDQKILDAAAAAFAAVDISTENAQFAAIEAKIAEAEGAIVAADERCSAIAREKQEFRGPSGGDVADALLAGGGVTEAARAGPDIASLEAERESLRAGIRDLKHRVEDWRAELANIEQRARQKLAPAATRLIEGLQADAREAAERLATVYASLAAVSATTRFGAYETAVTRQIVSAATQSSGPLPYGLRQVEVPGEINDALRKLDGKGRALRVGFISHAGI